MDKKTIRIRTTPGGEDKYIKIQLDQSVDQLEILSLKIDQDKLYTSFSSDYGVLIGRVIANEGKGVANAKISIFIPVNDEDKNNPRLNFLYPYKNVTDRNSQGVRYNLLPKGGRIIKIRKTTQSISFPTPPKTAPEGMIDMFNYFGSEKDRQNAVAAGKVYESGFGWWGKDVNGNIGQYLTTPNPNYLQQISSDSWQTVGNKKTIGNNYIGGIQTAQGGIGSNCNGLINTNKPNTATYPGIYAGNDFTADGYYPVLYLDAKTKLYGLNNNTIPLGVSPSPQNGITDDTSYKRDWNEAYYVPPKGYTLWKIEGKSGVTFQNFPSTGKETLVDVRTVVYTLSKCEFKAIPPDTMVNQHSDWVMISDNTDKLTGGTSIWECEIDVGLGNGPETPVGTFPNDYEVLDNDDILEVYDKYYKYTTRTNSAGDYMIFGVPVGTQTVHMDLDLSDIGSDSLRVGDMTSAGFSPQLFNGNKFKYSQDLDTLVQVISQNVSVNVIPLWGDEEISDTIGITRYDFKVTIKSNPTALLFFAYGFDHGNNTYDNSGSNGTPGSLDNMGTTTADGAGLRVESIVKWDKLYSYQGVSLQSYISDGIFAILLPCDQDKVITDEFGEEVLSGDDRGIGTTGSYRMDLRARFETAGDDDDYFKHRVPQVGDDHDHFEFKAGRKYTIKMQMHYSSPSKIYQLRNSDGDITKAKLNTQIPQFGGSDWVNGYLYFGRLVDSNKPDWLERGKYTDIYNVNNFIIDVTDYFQDLVNYPYNSLSLPNNSQLLNKMLSAETTKQDPNRFFVYSGDQIPGKYANDTGAFFLLGNRVNENIFKIVKKLYN